jgi:hypothetical protein
MKTAYLEEVEYSGFKRALGDAQRRGAAVVPSDRAAWAAAVRANDYKAEGFAFLANEKYGAKDLVIITGSGSWVGLYAADHEIEVCVRLRTKDVG